MRNSQEIAIPQDDMVLLSAAHCREIARRARNFYYGMRLTPEPRRTAIYAVYAFMRTCDDLVDEVVPVVKHDLHYPGKHHHDAQAASAGLARIEAFRAEMVRVLETGRLPESATHDPSHSIWPAFLWAARTFNIDIQHLHEMLDGQRDDLIKTRYRTFDELKDYCHKVAGVVGLVCIRVWGAAEDRHVWQLAEYRGLALQLTNILRDIVEDAQRDRIYLPSEELERFGYSTQYLMAAHANEAFDRLMTFQIERARSYYDMAQSLEEHISQDCRPTSWAIMKIYRELLDAIAHDPRAVLKQRLRLSGWRKASIAFRAVWDKGFHIDHDLGANLPPTTHASVTPSKQAANHTAKNQSDSAKPSVVVAGGGLAGIAAAIRLARAGLPVTLVETRKRLGGRATSFADPQTGKTLDNCQHVLMGCCTNLLDLYRILGVENKIEWHRKMYFTAPNGHIDEMEADDLPAPLHMTQSLMKFRGLTLNEKMAISRGMMAMMRLGKAGREKLGNTSFGQWLASQDQPPGAISKFWEVVAVSALNETLERCAANYALQVFQEGFLSNENSYVMGLSSVPLVELYDAAEQVITKAGGRVLLSTSVEALEFDAGHVKSLRIAGPEFLHADAFISAVPFDRLAKLCSEKMIASDARLQHLDEIDVSPILGIHMWFDKPIMKLPHLVLTTGPVQWVFNKGDDEVVGGQHLHGVISAAHAWVDVPAEKILDIAVESLRAALPDAANAKLIHGRVVKEKRATFSVCPGIDRLRPGPRGDIGNLYLAGDWCDSGWPATMEGAVRSGYKAAAAILEDLTGQEQTAVIGDLPAAPLYRVIGG